MGRLSHGIKELEKLRTTVGSSDETIAAVSLKTSVLAPMSFQVWMHSLLCCYLLEIAVNFPQHGSEVDNLKNFALMTTRDAC